MEILKRLDECALAHDKCGSPLSGLLHEAASEIRRLIEICTNGNDGRACGAKRCRKTPKQQRINTMTQQTNENNAAEDQSDRPALLEMRQSQEVIDALVKMADASEKAAAPHERDKLPDDVVWLNIFCASINVPNISKRDAAELADVGLREFKRRFSCDL